jgi:class 3 adenylate cyclase
VEWAVHFYLNGIESVGNNAADGKLEDMTGKEAEQRSRMARQPPKNFDRPDERVRLPGVEEDIVYVGDEMVARIVQHPGWRWSTDMRAVAGGDRCETHHVGVNLSGRQVVVLRDGSILEYGPGDIYDVPPGHDAYTVGDEPAVMIEWSGPRTWAGRDARFLDRALVTLLMTDVVGSTQRLTQIGDAAWRELIGGHVKKVRGLIADTRGREVDLAGDGFLVAFDGPARALRCAVEIRRASREDDLEVRAAVHIGEAEVVGDRLRGAAVHEAARVLSAAGPGEIFMSQSTRDLAVSAGMQFADRGLYDLKGIGERRLFELVE